MSCDACTKLTAKRIKNINGVVDATVDLKTKVASIEAERAISIAEINTAFSNSSYRAEEK